MGGGKIVESEEKLPNRVLCRVVYPICNIGKLNANHRIYGKDVWEKVFSDPVIKEAMEKRTLFGHSEHPEGMQSKTPMISHVINKMWMDEDTAYTEIDVLDTPEGRIIDALLEAGCNIGTSTRAEGDIREDVSEDGSKCYHVIAEAYNFRTTDFTADPSTFDSVPLDVKRGVVSTIRKEIENKEIKPEEKLFAVKLLESMKCSDKYKCQKCGICTEDTQGVRDFIDKKKLTVDDIKKIFKSIDPAFAKHLSGMTENEIDIAKRGKKVGLELTPYGAELLKESKTNEDQVTMVASGDGIVAVTGDIKQIIVDPQINTESPGGSVDVKVLPKDSQTATVTIEKPNVVPPEDKVLAVAPEGGTQPEKKEDEPDISDEEDEWKDEDFEEEYDIDAEDVEESKINERGKVGDKYWVLEDTYPICKKDDSGAFVETEGKKTITGHPMAIFVGEEEGTDGIFLQLEDGTIIVVSAFATGVDECKSVKALYKKVGLKAPKGKGIHTKAFHKCATNYAKKIKSGKMTKQEAYQRCMGGLGKKRAVKKSHQRNESAEELMTYIAEMLKINECYKVGQIVQINDKEGNTTIVPGAEVLEVDTTEPEGTIAVRVKGEDDWFDSSKYEITILEESKLNETKDTIFIDETGFTINKFGVYRKSADASAYLTFSFPTKEKAIELGKLIANMLEAEFSETRPEGSNIDDNNARMADESKINEGLVITIDTENAVFEGDAEAEIARILKKLADDVTTGEHTWLASRTLKDINGNAVGYYALQEAKTPLMLNKEIIGLQIKEATARAEKEVVVESLNDLATKDTENKILMKKVKESVDTEMALREAVEKKSETANDWMAKSKEVVSNIDRLEKELAKAKEEARKIADKLQAQVDKLTKEKEDDQKAFDVKMTQAKTDAVAETKRLIIKEYVSKGVTNIKVSDDQRALLESCQTIAETDKVLDECLDVSRRRALHTDPIKKVIVEKQKVEAPSPQLQQQRKIVNGILKSNLGKG